MTLTRQITGIFFTRNRINCESLHPRAKLSRRAKLRSIEEGRLAAAKRGGDGGQQ